MTRLNTQTTVSQNPKLLEEITWQESVNNGMVFMLKTDGFFAYQICFPTFNAISFSLIKNSNSLSTIFGDALQ